MQSYRGLQDLYDKGQELSKRIDEVKTRISAINPEFWYRLKGTTMGLTE